MGGNLRRVETDAVYRRFKNEEKKKEPQVKKYYCEECKQGLGHSDLEGHFRSVEHKLKISVCSECSRPVYKIKNNVGEDKYFHKCDESNNN